MISKRLSLVLLITFYSVSLIIATLFVPVKATVSSGKPSDSNSYTELGYYLIWETIHLSDLNSEEATIHQMNKTDIRVSVQINVTAWIIQYVTLTAVFAYLLFRLRRHLR